MMNNSIGVEHVQHYIGALGWAISKTPPGKKHPTHKGWNHHPWDQTNGTGFYTAPSLDAALQHTHQEPQGGFTLVHEPSGTAAFDDDETEQTRIALAAVNIERDQLFADNLIQIIGRPNRGKVIYRTPEGVTLTHQDLRWPKRPEDQPADVQYFEDLQTYKVFELRAGAEGDMLPPSMHPDTHQPYTWRHGWPATREAIPLLPPDLLLLWRNWDMLKQAMEDACPWLGQLRAMYPPKPQAQRKAKADTADSSRNWESVRASIKAARSISTQLESMGHSISSKQTRCPFPSHDDKKPSCTVYEEQDRFYCHACHKGGDSIDLYGVAHGIAQPGRAAAALAKELGVPFPQRKLTLKTKQHADFRSDDTTNGESNMGATAGEDWGEQTEQTGEPTRRAVIYTLEDFLALEIPPQEKILDPALLTQGITLAYSYRGVGKTHVSLGMAYAAASGGQFLKWEAEKPWKVLFVDGELPATVLQERFARKVASAERDCEPGDIRILTPDMQTAGIPSLSTPEGQRFIEDVLEDTQLLVLDNLSTLCRTGDENSAEAWLPVQEWLLRLRTKHVSTLIMHHAGKLGQQRGTSNREDTIDVSLKLKHPADYKMEEGARFEVHYEKARGSYGDILKPFEAHLIEADGKDCWVMRDLEDAFLEQVVEFALEGLTQREIAKVLDKPLTNVNRAIKKAKELGKI